MKKNLIIAAGAVLVAAAVSAFVYVNNKESNSTSLLKANAEALADGEAVTTWSCIGSFPRCVASCAKCGIYINSRGSLNGAHYCD